MYSTATHPCRHRFFFGVADPDLGCYRSNMAAIQSRLPDQSFRVRCLHCGNAIAGSFKDGVGEPVEVQWEHDGKTWFGNFHFREM